MSKKFDFSDFDLRRLDLTRKYDDDFEADGGIRWRDHALLYAVTALIAFFLLWASFTTLDEVSRGDGKVVPSSEIQVIQNLEGGIIDEFLVKEGDLVKAGQVLLRMRNTQAKADYGSTYQKYLAIYAAIARLEAEAKGLEPAFPDEVVKGAPDSVKAEQAAFEANRQQRERQAEVLKDQRSQREQDVIELKRRIADAGSVLKLSQDERSMVAPMVTKGAAAKKELLQIDQQIASRRAEMNGYNSSLPRAVSAVREAESKLAELESASRADAQKELSVRVGELSTIRQTLAAFEDKSARTEIKSPVSGTVKEVKIKTVGGVARPGEAIMEIVPGEDRLIVEARVRPADIAFIHPGQKAIVRLTAFDFSVYGAVDGTVIEISPDAIVNEKGESFYRVRVSTPETRLKKGSKSYDIIPGMQATVDIVTGKRTVMTYLLKPFVKASQTALRER
jgi:membrane fusion protein, adhesin transport system